MTFQETREQIDHLLETAVNLKDGPTPEKTHEIMGDLTALLAKLKELGDPKNDIHERVCGNREIEISSLESALTKVQEKAAKAAGKKRKKPVTV
jgi:hypothetical protein